MSKKILKRSLALGALMAFVITGSAMAAEAEGAKLTISSKSAYEDVASNGEWSYGLTMYSKISPSNNVLTIGNVGDIDKHIYVAYVSSDDEKVENNILNINSGFNTSKRLAASYVNSYSAKTISVNDNSVFVNGQVNLEHDVFAGRVMVNNGSGDVSIIVNDNSVTIIGAEGGAEVKRNVYGAYASATGMNSSVMGEGNAVNISGNTIVTNSIEGVFGAYAVANAPTGDVKTDATAILKDNSVTISGGEVTGNVYGAYACANIAGTKVGTINVEANKNQVNLSGGTVTGNVYGGYSVEVKTILGVTEQVAHTASNNSVNISGTANVEDANLYGNNGGEGEGNTLNIKGGWEGSIGSAQNFNAINITEGAKATFKTALDDANVAVNVKGATWNVDKTNTVGSASFDASSVLSIDGKTFEAKDSDNVYALNGSGELKVANGATLAIKGIDYVKYNVADGFNSIVDGNGNKFADGDEYWKLENTLMEGVWTTDNGLQVEIKAKKVEDLAEDMDVSVDTANTLTDILNYANANKDTIKENTPEAKVVELANALSAAPPKVAGEAIEAVQKMAEAGGGSATAAKVVTNVTGATGHRLSFGGGGGHHGGHHGGHKGGHGVGLFEEDSGAAIWAQYVHGKDSVNGMESSAGTSSYEGQYNGIVMGVDFKKVGKFQSGVAFNYGEGDTNSVDTSARSHTDYDFWGIGYYGNIRNADTNFIFDVNYAKTESDVTTNVVGVNYEASPETTTWTAGVKFEKLYQNENVQIVPYAGLRFMSIDPEDYTTECASNKYKMERQNIWLMPVGVSIRQDVVNDNGWVVSPKVDLSYIWAFGDTDSEMEFSTLDTKQPIQYEVMDEGSWMGLVGVEAAMDDWTFGVSYSYQKGDHSESKKWYVDAKYSF